MEMSLLEHATPADVRTDPFAHMIRREALAADVYERLAICFPPIGVIANTHEDLGSNQAVRMTCRRVFEDGRVSMEWKRFFEFHTSADHWRDITRIFAPHWRREFPDLKERVGHQFDDWRVLPLGYPGNAEVRLDCQFVMNTPVVKKSSVKPPHVDRHHKIFSALFYMRDVDDSTMGGDLDLYRWRRAPRFAKHRTLPGDVDLVSTIPYASNTYVCFVNSPRSVHGVSPREVTSIPRRYINFIAEVNVKAFKPRQAFHWTRWWRGVTSTEQDY